MLWEELLRLQQKGLEMKDADILKPIEIKGI